ncbi:actin, macronuclear isoform X1 [Lepeophtheirus salmonis]|uniref:actin, macronuclear isoform X1 n=1 Tax=Lepeophtheirus salmonis TaxID=72036 RepID=UPI003AF3893D
MLSSVLVSSFSDYLLDMMEEVGSQGSFTGLFDLPIELHVKILMMIDPLDVLSYSCACQISKQMGENHRVWKHQWTKLSSKTPFTFPIPINKDDPSINYKDVCGRLWRILVYKGLSGPLIAGRCSYCKEFTCLPSCMEDRNDKIALDIGGKMTWLITADFSLKRHLSMVAVPKVLRCFDCDTTLDRQECRKLHFNDSLKMTSHTALEYCSQSLSDMLLQPRMSRPFCLFCEDDKVNRLLFEREMVSSSKHKMRGFLPSYYEEEFRNVSAISPLTNGYCKDTASILGAENIDLLSPLLALENDAAFPVVRTYLSHIFHQFQLISDLQRPNCSFILTEPAGLLSGVKEHLLKFLFEEIKISRLCLLPKALALSQLFEAETCIVIDSGATSTSVWVVFDGMVCEKRTQIMSIGGWHVSQFLKQALTWKDNKDADGATISSLDTSTVKQKCRLSLNLSRENELKNGKFETLHIKSQRDHHKRLEMTEVTLSSELYLAPEMMYASLNLPQMVSEAARDLPSNYVKDCFSNILISGGNAGLEGFVQRLSSDLREILPEHAPIINVRLFPSGNHSWNTVMGANGVRIPQDYDNTNQSLHQPGTPLWISREEYILFGSHQLTSGCVQERC